MGEVLFWFGLWLCTNITGDIILAITLSFSGERPLWFELGFPIRMKVGKFEYD